jgi:hypothetical protein
MTKLRVLVLSFPEFTDTFILCLITHPLRRQSTVGGTLHTLLVVCIIESKNLCLGTIGLFLKETE